MTRKQKLILAAVTLIILIAAFVLFVPRYFFDEDHEITVHRVTKIDSNGLESDITDDDLIERLETTLYLMQVSRYKKGFSPYRLADTQYEISGRYQDKPFHITFGDSGVNYLYESADKGGYKIKNGDVWPGIMYSLTRET